MNMVVILAVVAAVLFLYLALKGKSKDDIFRTFGLDSTSYELVGTDLGKGHARKRISAHGVAGEPDAIFRHKRTGRLIVCEYKSRRWNRRMRPREYFQIVLYVGISREQFRTDDVIGILAFNDKTLEIEHNPTLCASLIQLRGEVLGSMKSKKALNSRPLLSRAKFPLPLRVDRF